MPYLIAQISRLQIKNGTDWSDDMMRVEKIELNKSKPAYSEISLSGMLTKESYNMLLNLFKLDEICEYKITTPDNSTFLFSGLLFDLSASADVMLERSQFLDGNMLIKIIGEVTAMSTDETKMSPIAKIFDMIKGLCPRRNK